MLKSVNLNEVKVGDEVEIEEVFPGLFSHLRGQVSYVSEGHILIGDEVERHVARKSPKRQILKVWVQQPDLPTRDGSVVKYYDSNFLRTSAAVRGAHGGWFDTESGGLVELERTNWTVLFDPEKDA
jgi:hypothetical protein